jgi:hypothetical protein
MGKISDENDKAFLVTLPGYDVNTATPEQFAVHSGFDYPKMEENLVGVVSYTVPNPVAATTYTILTVDHNLGYKPMVQCFLEDVDGTFWTEFAVLPYIIEYGPSDENSFRAYSTTTQFFIKLYMTFTFGSKLTGGEKFNFKYQIWVND